MGYYGSGTSLMFSEEESKTPISSAVISWIPEKVAKAIFGKMPKIEVEERYKEELDKVIKKNNIKRLFYSTEKKLSMNGRTAISIDKNANGEIILSVATPIVTQYEGFGDLIFATINRKFQTGSTAPYFIIEKHTKNKVTRSIELDGQPISLSDFEKDTGVTIKREWIHNAGVCMVEILYNLPDMDESSRSGDIDKVQHLLPVLDKHWARIALEVDTAGTKYLINTGNSGLQVTKGVKTAIYKALREDTLFDIGMMGGGVTGIGGEGANLIIKDAEYGKSLPFLYQSFYNTFSLIMTILGDHEAEFESTGTVQQNNFEREQEENSKILSIAAKTDEREYSIASLLSKIGALDDKLPKQIDDYEIVISPTNVLKTELTDAMAPVMGVEETNEEEKQLEE